MPGDLRFRTGVLVTMNVLAPLVAVGVSIALLSLVEAATKPTVTPPDASEKLAEAANITTAVLLLLAGAIAMALGWRSGPDAHGEPFVLLGAWTWTLLGFVLPQPPTWSVVPAFLLPWLLLLVELPQRQRVLLLALQWLASAMLFETVTEETPATVALFAIGLLHLVLVWSGLQGRWLAVGVVIGATLSLMVLGTAFVFVVLQPTMRRLLWVVAGCALLAFVLWLSRGDALAKVRPPTLLRRLAPTAPETDRKP